MTHGVPDGVPDGIPDGIPDGVPDDVPDGVPDGPVPTGAADRLSGLTLAQFEVASCVIHTCSQQSGGERLQQAFPAFPAAVRERWERLITHLATGGQELQGTEQPETSSPPVKTHEQYWTRG